LTPCAEGAWAFFSSQHVGGAGRAGGTGQPLVRGRPATCSGMSVATSEATTKNTTPKKNVWPEGLKEESCEEGSSAGTPSTTYCTSQATEVVRQLRSDPGWFSSTDYDEELVEDVFMGKQAASTAQGARMRVKNTFIHIDDDGSRASFTCPEPVHTRFASTPAVILNNSFHTKYPAMEQLHARKECRPCAYHVYKPDGCRRGDACEFCHLCTRGEIKKRKKENKSLRQQATEGEAQPVQ